jgi:hypothetical protein
VLSAKKKLLRVEQKPPALGNRKTERARENEKREKIKCFDLRESEAGKLFGLDGRASQKSAKSS